MKRKFWILLSLLALMILGIFIPSITSKANPDAVTLFLPSTCPAGGCAAGQRLNFRVDFSLSIHSENTPNTLICVFSEQENQEVSTTNPWADLGQATFSKTGMISGVEYINNEDSPFCKDQASASEAVLFSRSATHTNSLSDELSFALNINASASIGATLRVKIYQTDSNGLWSTTPQVLETFISTAAINSLAYVALDATDCGSRSPCFVNSGDNGPGGVGTGLRDAIAGMQQESEIKILGNYTIKDYAVIVDKDLTLSGVENASISYKGNICDQPMLSITDGIILENLTIDDGTCENPSRDLLRIDSPDNVEIKNNTLTNGARGIHVLDNSGNITIAYNHLADNRDYAVYREPGPGNGQLSIYANNIINNQNGAKINCNLHGNANHNYWSTNNTASWESCNITPSKNLGAPILQSPAKAGVEAKEVTVSSAYTEFFNGNIGLQHTAGANFNLIIVNHGQGQNDNIPFFQSGSGDILPCSNFYDIFLLENSQAENLILTIDYGLNPSCISIIESSRYCNHPDGNRAPIWWYDPANTITDGWDLAGETPGGDGAGNLTGQETSCDLVNDQITLAIDATGRPNNSDDLGFTPFVVGHQFFEGVILTQFTALISGQDISVSWTTSQEKGVQGFYIQRSDQEAGTFNLISDLIIATSSSDSLTTYTFIDAGVNQAQSQFYKLDVVDLDGNTIETLGAFSTLSSTPTATITPTITTTPTPTNTSITSGTLFPTRTATRYIFRTLTPLPTQRNTAQSAPTQVRTYGMTPTQFPIITTSQLESTNIDTGYPLTQGATPNPSDQNLGDLNETDQSTEVSLDEALPSETDVSQDNQENASVNETTNGSNNTNQSDFTVQQRLRIIQWPYLLLGIAGLLGVLGMLGLIIIKIRFPSV